MEPRVEPANTLMLKDHNTQRVRSALKQARAATCRDLSAATGLSVVTVGTILGTLVESGEVREGEQTPSNGGRPSRRYHFEERHALVLVLLARERGGQDTTSVRVADLYGQVIDSVDRPLTPRSLTDFEPLIDAMIDRHPRVRAMGFGLPGIVIDGTLSAVDYPSLVGAPLLPHFRTRYGLEVVFENDVNAAALGRGRRPGAPESEVSLYFPQKYPPGAGIRIGDRLVKGRRAFAGEVSWLPLGIRWGDPGLMDSVGAFSEAAARVIASLTAVVAPESVVLSGDFLTEPHRSAIEAHCAGLLPEGMVPRLVLNPDFTQDFEEGLIGLTLDLIEPR